MLVEKVKILCVLSLGVLFYSDSVESTCRCKTPINAYCCESASNPKDACCHVDGFDINLPIWVDSTPVSTTIGKTSPIGLTSPEGEDPTTPKPTTPSDITTPSGPTTAQDKKCAEDIGTLAQCISPFREIIVAMMKYRTCDPIKWLKHLKKIKDECKPSLVTPAECAIKFGIKGDCTKGFESLVEMCGKMEEACQDWGIANLMVDSQGELLPFLCIIAGGKNRALSKGKTGQCNPNDHNISKTRRQDVIEAAENCAGLFCSGSCMSNCMHREVGFSPQCSDCIGDGSSCGMDNCIWKCFGGPKKPKCKECMKKYCLPSFVRCSGFDRDIFDQ